MKCHKISGTAYMHKILFGADIFGNGIYLIIILTIQNYVFQPYPRPIRASPPLFSPFFFTLYIISDFMRCHPIRLERYLSWNLCVGFKAFSIHGLVIWCVCSFIWFLICSQRIRNNYKTNREIAVKTIHTHII